MTQPDASSTRAGQPSSGASPGSSSDSVVDGAYHNAYGTWVSEVMLQQTRVETVIPYWTRWMARWPTVSDLAGATEDDVNTAWAGLGFYRRARNLHKGAKEVVASHGGVLSSTVAGLKSIPGIGDYTAGAICSIAYGLPVPLVDGNVIRVFSRLRGLGEDAKSPKLAKTCWTLAGQAVASCTRPGSYNQSLMELGATVCSPKGPDCRACPLRTAGICVAFSEARQAVVSSSITGASSSSAAVVDIEDMGAVGAAAGAASAGTGAGAAVDTGTSRPSTGNTKAPKPSATPASTGPKMTQTSILSWGKKAVDIPPKDQAKEQISKADMTAKQNSGQAEGAGASGAAAGSTLSPDDPDHVLTPDQWRSISGYIADRYPLKPAKKTSPVERLVAVLVEVQGTRGQGSDSSNGAAATAPPPEPQYLLVRTQAADSTTRSKPGQGPKRGKKATTTAAAASSSSSTAESAVDPKPDDVGKGVDDNEDEVVEVDDNGDDDAGPGADGATVPLGAPQAAGSASPFTSTPALLAGQWAPLVVSLGRVAAVVDDDEDGEDEDGQDDAPAGSGGAGKRKASGRQSAAGQAKRPKRSSTGQAGSSSASSSPTCDPAVLSRLSSQLRCNVHVIEGGAGQGGAVSHEGDSSWPSLHITRTACPPFSHVFSHVTHDVTVEVWRVRAFTQPGQAVGGADSVEAACQHMSSAIQGSSGASSSSSSPSPASACFRGVANVESLGLTTWTVKALHSGLIDRYRAWAGTGGAGGKEKGTKKKGTGPSPAVSSAAPGDVQAGGAGPGPEAVAWAGLAARWKKAGLQL